MFKFAGRNVELEGRNAFGCGALGCLACVGALGCLALLVFWLGGTDWLRKVAGLNCPCCGPCCGDTYRDFKIFTVSSIVCAKIRSFGSIPAYLSIVLFPNCLVTGSLSAVPVAL